MQEVSSSFPFNGWGSRPVSLAHTSSNASSTNNDQPNLIRAITTRKNESSHSGTPIASPTNYVHSSMTPHPRSHLSPYSVDSPSSSTAVVRSHEWKQAEAEPEHSPRSMSACDNYSSGIGAAHHSASAAPFSLPYSLVSLHRRYGRVNESSSKPSLADAVECALHATPQQVAGFLFLANRNQPNKTDGAASRLNEKEHGYGYDSKNNHTSLSTSPVFAPRASPAAAATTMSAARIVKRTHNVRIENEARTGSQTPATATYGRYTPFTTHRLATFPSSSTSGYSSPAYTPFGYSSQVPTAAVSPLQQSRSMSPSQSYMPTSPLRAAGASSLGIHASPSYPTSSSTSPSPRLSPLNAPTRTLSQGANGDNNFQSYQPYLPYDFSSASSPTVPAVSAIPSAACATLHPTPNTTTFSSSFNEANKLPSASYSPSLSPSLSPSSPVVSPSPAVSASMSVNSPFTPLEPTSPSPVPGRAVSDHDRDARRLRLQDELRALEEAAERRKAERKAREEAMAEAVREAAETEAAEAARRRAEKEENWRQEEEARRRSVEARRRSQDARRQQEEEAQRRLKEAQQQRRVLAAAAAEEVEKRRAEERERRRAELAAAEADETQRIEIVDQDELEAESPRNAEAEEATEAHQMAAEQGIQSTQPNDPPQTNQEKDGVEEKEPEALPQAERKPEAEPVSAISHPKPVLDPALSNVHEEREDGAMTDRSRLESDLMRQMSSSLLDTDTHDGVKVDGGSSDDPTMLLSPTAAKSHRSVSFDLPDTSLAGTSPRLQSHLSARRRQNIMEEHRALSLSSLAGDAEGEADTSIASPVSPLSAITPRVKDSDTGALVRSDTDILSTSPALSPTASPSSVAANSVTDARPAASAAASQTAQQSLDDSPSTSTRSESTPADAHVAVTTTEVEMNVDTEAEVEAQPASVRDASHEETVTVPVTAAEAVVGSMPTAESLTDTAVVSEPEPQREPATEPEPEPEPKLQSESEAQAEVQQTNELEARNVTPEGLDVMAHEPLHAQPEQQPPADEPIAHAQQLVIPAVEQADDVPPIQADDAIKTEAENPPVSNDEEQLDKQVRSNDAPVRGSVITLPESMVVASPSSKSIESMGAEADTNREFQSPLAESVARADVADDAQLDSGMTIGEKVESDANMEAEAVPIEGDEQRSEEEQQEGGGAEQEKQSEAHDEQYAVEAQQKADAELTQEEELPQQERSVEPEQSDAAAALEVDVDVAKEQNVQPEQEAEKNEVQAQPPLPESSEGEVKELEPAVTVDVEKSAVAEEKHQTSTESAHVSPIVAADASAIPSPVSARGAGQHGSIVQPSEADAVDEVAVAAQLSSDSKFSTPTAKSARTESELAPECDVMHAGDEQRQGQSESAVVEQAEEQTLPPEIDAAPQPLSAPSENVSAGVSESVVDAETDRPLDLDPAPTDADDDPSGTASDVTLADEGVIVSSAPSDESSAQIPPIDVHQPAGEIDPSPRTVVKFALPPDHSPRLPTLNDLRNVMKAIKQFLSSPSCTLLPRLTSTGLIADLSEKELNMLMECGCAQLPDPANPDGSIPDPDAPSQTIEILQRLQDPNKNGGERLAYINSVELARDIVEIVHGRPPTHAIRFPALAGSDANMTAAEAPLRMNGSRACAAWITSEDRDCLFDFLASPDLLLFSANMKLSNRTLDSVLTECGGWEEAIKRCQDLADAGVRCGTTAELVSAVRAMRLWKAGNLASAFAASARTMSILAPDVTEIPPQPYIPGLSGVIGMIESALTSRTARTSRGVVGNHASSEGSMTDRSRTEGSNSSSSGAHDAYTSPAESINTNRSGVSSHSSATDGSSTSRSDGTTQSNDESSVTPSSDAAAIDAAATSDDQPSESSMKVESNVSDGVTATAAPDAVVTSPSSVSGSDSAPSTGRSTKRGPSFIPPSWVTNADRDRLFDYLASDECTLFVANVKISNRTLNMLLAEGGSCERTIEICKRFNENGEQFTTPTALIAAVKGANAQVTQMEMEKMKEETVEAADTSVAVAPAQIVSEPTATAAVLHSESAATFASDQAHVAQLPDSTKPDSVPPAEQQQAQVPPHHETATENATAQAPVQDAESVAPATTTPATPAPAPASAPNLASTSSPAQSPAPTSSPSPPSAASPATTSAPIASPANGPVAVASAIPPHVLANGGRSPSPSAAKQSALALGVAPPPIRAAWITEDDRDALFDYLSSEECTLFNADVKLSNRTLDAFLTEGGSLDDTIAYCQSLNHGGQQFSSTTALLEAVKLLRIEREEQERLALAAAAEAEAEAKAKANTAAQEAQTNAAADVSDSAAATTANTVPSSVVVAITPPTAAPLEDESNRGNMSVSTSMSMSMSAREPHHESGQGEVQQGAYTSRPAGDSVPAFPDGRRSHDFEHSTVSINSDAAPPSPSAPGTPSASDNGYFSSKTSSAAGMPVTINVIPPTPSDLSPHHTGRRRSEEQNAEGGATNAGSADTTGTASNVASAVSIPSATSMTVFTPRTAAWIKAVDRDQLFDYLASPECLLFAVNVKLNNKALDSLLVEGGSTAGTIDLCSRLNVAGLQYQSVAELVQAVREEAAKGKAATNGANPNTNGDATKPAADVAPASAVTTISQPTPATIKKQSATAASRSSKSKGPPMPLVAPYTSNHATSSSSSSSSSGIPVYSGEDRDALFDVLADPSTQIFSQDVKLSNRSLDRIIHASGASRQLACMYCRELYQAGMQFATVKELCAAVKDMHETATQLKKNIRTFIMANHAQLLQPKALPLDKSGQAIISQEVIDDFFLKSESGLSTLSYLIHVQSLGVPAASMDELAAVLKQIEMAARGVAAPAAPSPTNANQLQ